MGGIASLGSSIARGDGSGPPEVFTIVAEVVSISGVNITAGIVDTTTLDSPNRYEEAVSTLIRTGETELGLNFDPNPITGVTHKQFITDMEGEAQHSFRITFSDTPGTAWTVSAIVTGFNIGDISPESKLEATATLKVSGQPTYS